jgi:catalase
MTEAQAAAHHENPFDVTKTWSQKEYPLIEVGQLELNRNPLNYFAEVEQAAFGPSNMVPGVGLSPDRMLQGRVFAYADAHRYRIGTNYQQLPVNLPRSPVHSYQRDGAMRFGDNGGGAPNYEPNSYSDAPKQAPQYAEPGLALSGLADRYDHREDGDYFSQAGKLFNLMSAAQKAELIGNIAGTMASVSSDVVQRQLQYFFRADPAYGQGIADALGVKLA